MRHVASNAVPVGSSQPIPAPSRGMNTLASYLSLPPDKARYLENFIPTTGKCVLRPGWSPYAEISGATKVHSLFQYNSISGVTPIAVADDGKIYAVSSGSVAELASGYSATALWVGQNQNGYLVAVNGTDTPWIYNGTVIASTSFSGVTQSTLRTVRKVGERLWFTVNNSPHVWYTDPKAIAGPLTQFQLGQIAEGGYCLGVFQWRTFTLMCMSTGEVLAYQGDPATNLSLYATYKAPILVEHDAAVQVGSELVLITRNGPIPMEQVAAGLAFDADSLAGWAEIQPSWSADVNTYGANDGWRGFYNNGMCYFIVPTASDESKLWVYNLNVPGGAWTSYTGIYATHIISSNDGVLYGDASSGRVCIHSGNTDNEDNIVAIAKQGFTYPSAGKFNLQFSLARLNFNSTGRVSAILQIDTDFQEKEITGNLVDLSSEGGGGAWDSEWDSEWGYPATVQLRWQKINGFGRAVAPVVKIESSSNVDWYATGVFLAPATVAI